MLDELDLNINMKGGGDIGGEKYLCEKGVIPLKKLDRNDKYFTLLGLGLISGIPLMCVVVFSRKRRNLVVELGIDPFVE